ncbi:class I SAM-dependent methyltransferase [Streptomyces sp. BA2]|uniref:class I SAM-dependent methyltransferase n=1 Tax=Streptomyces sp. BA2 TaxID=436595 RepID=UPI0013266AAC|nr:class I SAM-dependent methyltransferase [Streptomyces sp. BA2]MWA16235.1 methyltransferase domain-containing protein [Streptomyces sp. BA2]
MPDDTTESTAATDQRRITELIADHPWVAHIRPGPDGVLLVTPRPSATAVLPTPGPLVREHLAHWAEVYEWVYETGEGRHADDLDLSGWRTSGTGEPLSAAHMRDWVDRTVELILAQRPRRLLELGCGTGLLAHRLHTRLDGYVGTDVTDVAVDRLRAAGLPRTAFVRAAAHEAESSAVRQAMEGVFGPGARPDCVLLNSVTQCFPNLLYLTAFLHHALAAVEDGGTVIIGDIRHSALLEDHFGRMERARDPEASDADITARVAAAVAADGELSFAPEAVREILAAHPRTVRMSVHARTMAEDSELTRYRYDLVLHVGPTAGAPDASEVRRLPWQGPGGEQLPAELRAALTSGPVVLHGIANALLTDAPDAVTPYDLRQVLTGMDAAVLLDPADPRMLAVAAPAHCATAAAHPPADALAGRLAHEPLPAFVRRRLPEVLRDHIRRTAPGTVPPRIVVDEASEASG